MAKADSGLDREERLVRIPRSLDPVPQPWQDRLQEKLWRARVYLNEKNRDMPAK